MMVEMSLKAKGTRMANIRNFNGDEDKHVYADAEEADDSGSLLFDLATLRRATANFAEENKLGHGGFGAVYKVPLLESSVETHLSGDIQKYAVHHKQGA